MDATDRSILTLLQQNAKYTIKELAAQLNLSTTPVFERIKRLERDGFILGYQAEIDASKVGLGLMVYCDVSLNQHHTEFISKFAEEIVEFPEVLECYHVGGTYDFLLKVLSPDMMSYQQFITQRLASLENIGKVQSSFVMNVIKKDRFIPV